MVTVIRETSSTDLTTEDLRHIQAKLHAKGEKKPGTINRYFAFLRRALTLAVKDDKLVRNPVSGINFFPETHRIRYLSDEELARLKGVMERDHWKLVVFAVETGLRQSE